jgi:DNA-binding NarL/FixJ family response regulator
LLRRSTILLADDHGLILAGIQGLLGGYYDIVEQVRDGRSLVASAVRLKPDLIILDISMPLLNGIEAARHIKKAWAGAKLLFLTMHASPAYLKEAMDAGGMGYVLKSSANEELRSAVQKVLKGQIYVSPSFDRDVLEAVQASQRRHPRSSAPFTFRQAEVLQLVAEGWGNKEIANLLKVSVKTVDFHRGRIMRKLGAHNAAELVRYAVQAGVVGV